MNFARHTHIYTSFHFRLTFPAYTKFRRRRNLGERSEPYMLCYTPFAVLLMLIWKPTKETIYFTLPIFFNLYLSFTAGKIKYFHIIEFRRYPWFLLFNFLTLELYRNHIGTGSPESSFKWTDEFFINYFCHNVFGDNSHIGKLFLCPPTVAGRPLSTVRANKLLLGHMTSST